MSVRYLNANGTQALIDTIKQRLATKADQSSINAILTQVQLLSDSIPTKTSQLTNDSEFVTAEVANEAYAAKTDLTAVATIVESNQTAINLLNADNTTPGSVDYKIAQAVSAGSVPVIRPASKEQLLDGLAAQSEAVAAVVVIATGITDDSGNLVNSDLHTMLTRADDNAWIGTGWAGDKVYTIRAFPTRLESEGIEINPTSISQQEIEELF